MGIGLYGSFGFVYKLRPDGPLGYSTSVTPVGTTPDAVAIDVAGSVYLTGATHGGIITTPGAYRSHCSCGLISTGFVGIPLTDTSLLHFSPDGAQVNLSTYLG